MIPDKGWESNKQREAKNAELRLLADLQQGKKCGDVKQVNWIRNKMNPVTFLPLNHMLPARV